jgi:hypothetical protein
LPLWLFKKYNSQLDIAVLMPGTGVWIPIIEEKTEQEIQDESIATGGLYQPYDAPEETPRARTIERTP